MKRSGLVLLFVLTCVGSGCRTVRDGADGTAGAGASWRQWGGPNGDFKVEAPLASSWPENGPPVLWQRELGPGYSTIGCDRGTLYTMYRDEDDEIAVALDAESGDTIWEHRYAAPPHSGNVVQFGAGPNAGPLILDDRIVTLGYTGILKTLDRTSGEVLWQRDLIADLGGVVLDFGNSASPIAHGDQVIVLVGGEQQAVVALDLEDGSVGWRSDPGSISYATPTVIDVSGQDQLIYFAADAVVALDPETGRKLWDFPVVNQYRNNCTPVWWGDGLLWVATQLDGGTRALRLTRQGDATEVAEAWSSNELSIHFWNSLRLGRYVYASIGSNASILAGIDVETGQILWRERGFEQVNFVHAGELTLMLDGKGQLALARLSPEGIEVLARARVTEETTWTVPTLIGTTLYLRDQQTIRALGLS